MVPRGLATISMLVLCAYGLLSPSLDAQRKPAVSPSDYGQWETLAPQRTPLSPDGRWLVYGAPRSNRNNELRVTNISTGAATPIAFGEQPAFSADSQWLAYLVGFSEAQEAKLRKDKKPLHKRLGLLRLGTTEPIIVEGVETFAFDASGQRLAMRRYPPERKEDAPGPQPGGGAQDVEEKPGATLIVRILASGDVVSFGNVSEYAWQSKGSLLAMTIDAEGRTGNGVHVFDPSSGALRVLDSASAIYSGLTWRKDADDLAVLRSKTDERRDGPTHVALAWRKLSGGAVERSEYDQARDSTFASGLRIVSYRRPSWSEDGAIVFLGAAAWDDKPGAQQTPGGDTPASGGVQPADDDDEPASVDVWHPKDPAVIPRQRITARTDRQKNMLGAWRVADNRFVHIATSLDEDVTPVKRQPRAVVVDTGVYGMERSIGRVYGDVLLADIATGARTKVKDRIEDRYVQTSPGGRYLLYVADDHYWTFDVSTGAHVNISKGVATSFVDRQSDATIRQKPAYGVAGWTKGDEAVWLYDQFDIWEVRPDGSKPLRLTDGSAEHVRHRYLKLNPDEEWIERAAPQHLEMFGVWTKKSGFGRLQLDGAAPRVHRLVWLDKRVDRLAKARDANVYAYIVQAFDDSPDYFVGGADLAAARAATATNPFMTQYAWGRSELVEYKSDRGERLQGALFYPASFEPGKKYPMVVYMYEKRSDFLHVFSAPSERDPYNAAAFTSRGYFFLQPDIVFRPREPGVSVVECVTPAVKRVVQMGHVDARKVGIVGHSWGGFDTVFLATHTDVFAAGVAGAPITNLVSNYGNHHWSSGIAETDHIETGQQRMEVPLYEDLPAYIRNSAVFSVHTMKTPLLVAFGESDGTVHWHQGVEMYNIGRRAGKQIVMLAYAGEDHGLRKKPNQMDYHRRIFEWFDHYLQDRPAPTWVTDGVRHLDREKELQRQKAVKSKQKTTTPDVEPRTENREPRNEK